MSEEFTQLAEGAGASRDSYLAKMATQSVELAARAEWRLGASRGVSSTPTFFVNGARPRPSRRVDACVVD